MSDDNGGQPPVYTVAGKDYVIRPFKGSKGVRAFAIMSRVGERARPIMESDAQFVRTYRETNVDKITRGMAEYRRSVFQQEITDLEVRAKEVKEAKPDDEQTPEDFEAWQEAMLAAIGQGVTVREARIEHWTRQLDGPLSRQEFIEIPREPGVGYRVGNVMMQLWDIAEPEMTMLLGLALISDEDLKQARGAPDGAEEAIKTLGESALYELYLDECGEVILSALEVAAARMRSKAGGLGNRVRALTAAFTTTPEEAQTTEEAEEEPSLEVGGFVGHEDDEEAPETSPTGSEPSSTLSPTDTGGTPTESSSGNSGQTSSAIAN